MTNNRRTRQFVITNTVALNGGDAAILRAIVHLLRKRYGQETTIHVFDSQPEIAKRYYPDLTFHPHLALNRRLCIPRGFRKRVRRTRLLAAVKDRTGVLALMSLSRATREGLRCYKNADAIISTGGTYLAEQYSLWDRFLDFELVEALGKGLILYTQSVGAFENDLRAAVLARVFAYAKLVLLRDEQSLAHAERFGGQKLSHWHVQPDVAFALADPKQLEGAVSRTWPERGAKVLVSVRHWQHFRGCAPEDGRMSYRSSIAALVTELVRRGAQVTFLSTCQGIPEYWMDDSQEAALITDLLDESVRPSVTVDRDYHSPEALMVLASQADLVVSTRLHMAILSLSAGTPVLPIGYEHKTRAVFAQLGDERRVLDIDTLTPQQAVDGLSDYLDSLPARRLELFQAVDRLREGALRSIDLFDQAIASDVAPAGHG